MCNEILNRGYANLIFHKLTIKKASQRQQLEGGPQITQELHIYIETFNKLLQSKWILEGIEVYMTKKIDQTD